MKVWFPIFPLSLLLSLSLQAEPGPEADESFSHEVNTGKKPWTKKAFRNHSDDFQFMIVTDRTGGMRPGVFASAVPKINAMQPEFVISVGDLIAGGRSQRNEKEIWRQWNEFNGLAESFEMPFFYLPGNHDVSNEVCDRIWDEQFGVRYYTFIYKDVLFLCLNTQDGEGTRPFLGKEQIEWAKAELGKHPDVRWTLVFIHQPLWLTEEGSYNKKKSLTGWQEVEEALSGRKHTVFAGHVHRYARYERRDTHYFTLGTTGGGTRNRGEAFGEFDHATWITMTDEGPRMMNLTLAGMLPEKVATEANQQFWRGLRFSEEFRETYPFQDKVVTLPIENPFDFAIAGELSWLLPATDHWSVEPRKVTVQLEPGEKKDVRFAVSHEGDLSNYFPLPSLRAKFFGEEGAFDFGMTLYLPLDLMEHARKHTVTTVLSRAEEKPTVDGQLIEAMWKKEPTIARLIPMKADGYAPMETKAWLSYDEENLYVGMRCFEALMRDAVGEVNERDGDMGKDHFVEVLFDTNRDKKTFFHFMVNPMGTLYDARGEDATWDSTATVATHREMGAWTVEMAIPLAEIQGDGDVYPVWGLQVGRYRPRLDEGKRYQWAPTIWFRNTMPSLFGKLELE